MSESPTTRVKAKVLSIGDSLYYNSAELVEASPSAVFHRRTNLVGSVVSVEPGNGVIAIGLDFDRSIVIDPDELRTIELPDTAPCIPQATLGKGATFLGVSIE